MRLGRIMIVGQGRVGKTALTNALVGNAYEPTDRYRSFECSWLRLLLLMCYLSRQVKRKFTNQIRKNYLPFFFYFTL